MLLPYEDNSTIKEAFKKRVTLSQVIHRFARKKCNFSFWDWFVFDHVSEGYVRKLVARKKFFKENTIVVNVDSIQDYTPQPLPLVQVATPVYSISERFE